MNSGLARLLTSLYPRHWRQRYGAEFEALLETTRLDLRTSANVVWSALVEHASPTLGLAMKPFPASDLPFLVRAPWATFGLLPVLLLAAAYLLACLILWSGWKIFLPNAATPFVAIEGLAVFYFGLGRLLYFGAPVLIGWGAALLAARQKLPTFWPALAFTLTALIGGTAHIEANHPSPSATAPISMHFALGPATPHLLPASLSHALVILSLTALPYLIWRMQLIRLLR